jgi:hypothetical protein
VKHQKVLIRLRKVRKVLHEARSTKAWKREKLIEKLMLVELVESSMGSKAGEKIKDGKIVKNHFKELF